MKKIIRWPAVLLAMVLLFVANSCSAGSCRNDDSWKGRDKELHAAGGALVAGAVTAYTRDWPDGAAAGAVLGFGKELWDAHSGRTCTLKDAIVTTFGGFAGAGVAGLVIRYSNGRTTVAMTWELR